MPDELTLLHSIDNSLKLLVRHFGANTVPVNGNVPASKPAYAGPKVATDREMDGRYGDPTVRTKDPKDWTGDVMRDAHFSECSPEYLDLYADFLDWMGDKAEEKGDMATNGKPIADYKRRDAALARGWAARKRSGWKAETETASGFPSDAPAIDPNDDIPF